MKLTGKAKELRIGNWYECHEGDKMNNTAIVQLKDIIWTNDGIGYELKHLNDRAVGVTICPEKLNPIPLTEEWLERFGIMQNTWFEDGSYMIKEDRGFGWEMYVRNAVKTKRISFAYFKHVHQLQNLYYALTGEELNQNKDDE